MKTIYGIDFKKKIYPSLKCCSIFGKFFEVFSAALTNINNSIISASLQNYPSELCAFLVFIRDGVLVLVHPFLMITRKCILRVNNKKFTIFYSFAQMRQSIQFREKLFNEITFHGM